MFPTSGVIINVSSPPRRALQLPPASPHAQLARRLEIDAMEAKNSKRFTRELLKSHTTILEKHKQDVVVNDDNHVVVGQEDKLNGRIDTEEFVKVKFRKKKKKRKKERLIKPHRRFLLTVNTSKARSSVEILTLSLNQLGWQWKEHCVNRRGSCDLYWHGGSFYDNDNLSSGKVNKFPGLQELVRKAQLSKLLVQMQHLFPKEYEFYPKTWLLPEQFHHFCSEVAVIHQQNPKIKPTFIVKPDGGSQGEGIYLINDPYRLSTVGLVRPAIVQEYVTKPLLLERTKFDLRVYVLLASIEPLQIYICREGMARFCTMKYQEPTTQNLHEVFMHLTNYSLNKHSENYVHTYTGARGSKRTMSSVFVSLTSRGHDTFQLWEDIEELVVKTITAILPDLKVLLNAELPVNKPGPTCFQILGFDILVSNQMKPILLEVNSSPSLRLDYDHEVSPGVYEVLPSPADEEIKIPFLKDVLRVIRPGHLGRKQQRPRSASSSSGSYSDISDSRTDVTTPDPMSEEDEDPLHDSCLVDIWPRKYGERYEHLRIIERVARLYGIFLGVRGAHRMGATGFRTFSRRCKLCSGSLPMAAIDIMYIDITRRWNIDLLEGTAAGMAFGAFLEAFFLIARKKARGDTLLRKVVRLVEHCECNLNEGMLTLPRKDGRRLRRPKMVHYYRFGKLGPLDN